MHILFATSSHCSISPVTCQTPAEAAGRKGERIEAKWRAGGVDERPIDNPRLVTLSGLDVQ
jgi:hypothetical protein